MAYVGETAYITGGASGIGRALATMLVNKGMKVVIADRNAEGAQTVVKELNRNSQAAWSVHVDVADWQSQLQGFEAAVEILGKIDYTFAVAAPLDVNATGALYTTSLAVQQFHRQEPNKYSFRGKVIIVASGAGFYYIPAMPIYTASKHAIVGLVRSLGVTLPDESITLNAICPGIVRTNIGTGDFYEKAEKNGLLVPMESVLDTFEALLGGSKLSGEAIEVISGNSGYRIKERAPYTNEKCRESVEMTNNRSKQAAKAAQV